MLKGAVLENAINDDRKKAMGLYYRAKELMQLPLSKIPSLKEVEELFKESIQIYPDMWASKLFLGELLFKQGKFDEAEGYLREAIKYVPDSILAKYYITECLKMNALNKNIDDMDYREILYVFENNIRHFIKTLLYLEFGNDWWDRGIPSSVRAKCAGRREQSLKEERHHELLLFADFYHYKEIFNANRKIFANYFDIKKWGEKLTFVESLRNSIAHNRPFPKSSLKIREYYEEFEDIVKKV
ncbi:MAG: tetratricopeptide repeat protein [Nanoarchaeota archaeon]|nr:tetratricopeptide repeat protein [Nanoarchaeota archaeon]